MNRYFAEGFGTFVLVFVGCASIVYSGEQIGMLGIGLTFGFTLIGLIYLLGPVSGAHFNPLVSIVMMRLRALPVQTCVFYIFAQMIGATLAAALLYLLSNQAGGGDILIGQTTFAQTADNGYGPWRAFVAEAIFSAIFLLVILGVTAKGARPEMAGLAIGLSLTAIHYAGIPLSGASVNFARTFGPALFAGSEAMSQLWVYGLAHLLGIAIAILLARYVTANDDV